MMTRWAMVIDLRKCIGCGTCRYVCTHVNKVPTNVSWRRLADCEILENSKRERLFLTMSCMHCGKAPCLKACPTNATYRRPDGIIDINYELCTGCGSCIVACPYLARSISFKDSISLDQGNNTENATVARPDRIGICTKCNFCLSLLDAGLAHGLQPGVDPEATPICVRYCIADAMHFGNLDESENKVSKMIRENKTICLQEELSTEPSVYYILDGEDE